MNAENLKTLIRRYEENFERLSKEVQTLQKKLGLAKVKL